MTLRPLQDWAVIRKSEPKERTAGGIIIPEVAKEKPLEGVIVAIGPGKLVAEKGKEKEREKKKKFVPTVLKPGQHIIYQEYAEREIELDGEAITLVREEDILGTVEERAIAEKNPGTLEQKKDGPVALREKAHVPLVPPAKTSAQRVTSEAKKAVATKATAKKPPKRKKKEEKEAKKPVAKKSSPKKSPAKKTPAAGKTTESKKTAAKKIAQKTAPKKAAAKKPAAKKPAAKKAIRPAAKKSATRKPAQKRPAKGKKGKK